MISSDSEAGIVFRAATSSVYYYATIGFASGRHRIVKHTGSSSDDVELATSGQQLRSLDSSNPSDRYHLEVSLSGPSIEIRLDGARIMTASDSAIVAGDVGLWASGATEFDDLKVSAPCLVGGGSSSSGCRDLFYQDECSFECRKGFDTSGTSTSICKDDGTLNQPDGAPQCNIRAPVALN